MLAYVPTDTGRPRSLTICKVRIRRNSVSEIPQCPIGQTFEHWKKVHKYLTRQRRTNAYSV